MTPRLRLLLLTACFAAAAIGWPALAAPAIALGQEFSLPVGASAPLAGGLQVHFERVGPDGRCPRGAQCISAGDAVVQLEVQGAGVSRTPVRLHTAATAATTAVVAGHRVELLQLQPTPELGRTVAPRAYVATLRVVAAEAAGGPPSSRR